MKGLWDLPTRMVDPGLSLVVWDGIVAFVVVFLTILGMLMKSKHWTEPWILHTGMVLLSMWFFTHWIDITIHHFRVTVTYGFILVDCLYNSFKIISDVFVFLGTYRILLRYKSVHIWWDWSLLSGLFFVCCWLLAILAFYHVCLMWVTAFAWLSFADVDVINSLAKGSSAFAVAYAVLQFCLMSFVGFTAWAVYGQKPYEVESRTAFFGVCVLMLRCFCEVVIVGQLDRNPANLAGIAKARDGTYGLFSILFLLCMLAAVPMTENVPVVDPLVAEERVEIKEARADFAKRLNDATGNGTATGPTIDSIIDEAIQDLGVGTTAAILTKKRELKRLRKLYAGYEPIVKWQPAVTAQSTQREDYSSRRTRAPRYEY